MGAVTAAINVSKMIFNAEICHKNWMNSVEEACRARRRVGMMMSKNKSKKNNGNQNDRIVWL